MKKALITGSEGFVGRYMRRELQYSGYQVIGLDCISAPETIEANLLDPNRIRETIATEKPQTVIHLAAQANVGKSWKEPQLTMSLNLLASINLLEALRQEHLTETRVVFVGSSDQYGTLGSSGARISEEMSMKPCSPYAISKMAQEEIAKLYVSAYGMNICMTRSFNHGGAGQKPGFIIPDFASGIVQIEQGKAKELLVGNLTSRRDYTHVKDVVRAYRLIAEKGRAGEVYNVGSGVTYSAQELLNMLCRMAKCPIMIKQDPTRMRPSDTPIICCDHTKLTAETGWEPEIPLEKILLDTLEYYRDLSA